MNPEVKQELKKVGRVAKWVGKQVGKLIILGVKEHPDVIPTIIAAVACHDPRALAKVAIAIAEAGAAAKFKK